MQQGEVYWADLQGPAGRRPVVLLTRNTAYKARTSITVATVTRTIRGIAVEVRLGPEDGLPAQCVVNLDDIITVRKSRIKERISMLSQSKLSAVKEAAIFALDLS